MRKLWEFLWDGCWHRWEAKEKVTMYREAGDKLPLGTKYIYQCSKCFKIKSIKDYR